MKSPAAVSPTVNAGIITVGDELLAGDIENTNARWLATQLADRGVAVRRIVTLPDDVDAIARRVRTDADRFDAVLVTGGLGGTPDDVTMDAVARAFDRPLEVDELARADVIETLDRIRRERRPGLELDIEAEASLPAGASPILNEVGISPGCVIDDVYVFPGVPREMKRMFETVADRFVGDLHTRSTRTARPESHIAGLLSEAKAEFDVAVGSYPNMDDGTKRIKVSGVDPDRVDAAYEWLAERLVDEGSTS